VEGGGGHGACLVSSEVALKLRLVFIPALALVMEVLMVEVEVEMAKGEHGIVDHCRVSNIIYSNSVLAVSS
jgi:hypothetical protein